MDSLCPECKSQISPDFNFCPNCGKKFKDAYAPISISAQIVVYFVSLFVPPFGLWYIYKYLKNGGETQKKIGWAALILTVISIGLTVWSAEILISTVNQALMGLNY